MPEIIYKIAVNSENINLNLLNILTLLSVKKSGILKIFIKNSNPKFAFLNLTYTLLNVSNIISVTNDILLIFITS